MEEKSSEVSFAFWHACLWGVTQPSIPMAQAEDLTAINQFIVRHPMCGMLQWWW